MEFIQIRYNNPDIALNCGIILRECLRHEQLCRIVIKSLHLWKFFQFVESASFDVSSDAFASFKDILTRHKPLVAGFLEANYDKVNPSVCRKHCNFLVFRTLHAVAQFKQLCDSKAVSQGRFGLFYLDLLYGVVTRRDSARSNKFQCHDKVHIKP